MIMLQDGVRVFVLPDESHCIRDEESRSPIDLKMTNYYLVEWAKRKLQEQLQRMSFDV